jgi:hypothetical protein
MPIKAIVESITKKVHVVFHSIVIFYLFLYRKFRACKDLSCLKLLQLTQNLETRWSYRICASGKFSSC